MASYSDINTLYVSEKTGSDNNLGIHFTNDRIMNGPVKTIDRALVIVSEMRRSEYRQPITVALMDDEYDFAKTLEIKNPLVRDVTFAPFGGGDVLFSGGKQITGWAPDAFMGADCLSVFLPEVKEGKWRFSDLYVGGRPAAKTRTPAEGYFLPESVENTAPGMSSHSRWFIARPGDIPENAKNVEDALINFCHYWVDEHSRIAAFDPKTRRVDFDGRTRMTISAEPGNSATMAYYIENLAEAFRNPGEWYLDRPEGKLYYIPKEGETAENIVVYAPVIDRIVNVVGQPDEKLLMRGIRFRNIRFAYTKGEYQVKSTRTLDDGTVVPENIIADGQCAEGLQGVVNLFYATGCSFDECGIYAIGSHGIVFRRGCFDCRVCDTYVRYAAGGGVTIGGGDVDEEPIHFTHNITVSDCIFEELGLRYFSASGVLITHAFANEISHNTIRHLYYSGVCCGWRWGYAPSVCRDNLIMYNHIYDLGRGILSDMGGVYTLGMQPGTRVEGNVIHDVKSRNYGGWGLYTDEGSAYITFRNNIVYNCSSNCYHQHYGRMNTITNNIFVSAGEQLIRITRREAQKDLIFTNNIYVVDGDTPVYGNITNCDFSADRNIIWSTGGKATMLAWDDKTWHFDEFRTATGIDEHSREVNPRFKNLAAHDFTLRADSPAFALGFRAIDASAVGPRGILKENA